MTNPITRAVLLFLLVLTFGVLIFGGVLIHKEKPPIPGTVKSAVGTQVFTGKDVIDGQNYYFSRGGQNIGTIWGHGSYLAPDWSADFLHRMGLFIAARYHGLSEAAAKNFTQKDFDALDSVVRANLSARATKEIKTNQYVAASDTLTYTNYQAEAYTALIGYYTTLFQGGNEEMGSFCSIDLFIYRSTIV